jgi:hypothetical protein
VKRKKRRLEAIDDDAVNVVAIQTHPAVAKPELARNRRVRNEPVVGVDCHPQPQIMVELEWVASKVSHRASLHV